MKSFLKTSVLLSTLLLSSLSSASAASPDVSLKVNSVISQFSPSAIIKDSTTMVPLRALTSAINAGVEWTPSKQSIRISTPTKNLTLKIGSSEADIDGKKIDLSTPPIIIDGTTYVPVRFISEAFGASVGWEPETRTVSIETSEIVMNTVPSYADDLPFSVEIPRGWFIEKSKDAYFITNYPMSDAPDLLQLSEDFFRFEIRNHNQERATPPLSDAVEELKDGSTSVTKTVASANDIFDSLVVTYTSTGGIPFSMTTFTTSSDIARVDKYALAIISTIKAR